MSQTKDRISRYREAALLPITNPIHQPGEFIAAYEARNDALVENVLDSLAQGDASGIGEAAVWGNLALVNGYRFRKAT